MLLHTLNYRYEGPVDCEQDTSTKKLDLIEHKHFCLVKYQEETRMTVWKLWEKHNSSQQLQYYKLNSKACPDEFPISHLSRGDSQPSWAFLGHCFGSQWKNICLCVHLNMTCSFILFSGISSVLNKARLKALWAPSNENLKASRESPTILKLPHPFAGGEPYHKIFCVATICQHEY